MSLFAVKTYNILLKRVLAICLCTLFVLAGFVPAAWADSEDLPQKVRIGWYQSDLFQEGMSNTAPRSGYGYEYIQKVSDYTSWRYEYVYGKWPELYDMLLKGEIDLLGAVSRTNERQSKMLFPDYAMGTDRYFLYKRADDASIIPTDYSSISGKRVGLMLNNNMSVFAQRWLEEHQIPVQYIYFDSFVAMNQGLLQGKVDLIARTLDNTACSSGITSIASLGEEPFYLAVSRYRPDLLSQLNQALALIISIDPYVLQRLQYESYGASFYTKRLTWNERQWLAAHPVIKVGYFDNYLPYSGTTRLGQATGLMTDVLSSIISTLELQQLPTIKYQAYSSTQDMEQALQRGEIDIAFPVRNDPWLLEQAGISATSEVISDSGTLFYKNNKVLEDIKVIAVSKHNTMQDEYTRLVYPEAAIAYYPTIDACLQAVLNGEADGVIMNSMRIQYVTGKSQYSGLSYIQLTSHSGKSFGVSYDNKNLLLFLNRGIKALGPSYGLNSSYKYIGDFCITTPLDFIKNHLVSISLLCFCLLALVLHWFIINLRRKEQELLEKEALKKAAENANLAKTSFLFNMSHDIRTPMNAVLGFAQLMEKELDQPAKLKEHLAKIQFSGQYLLGLINNVLEVARIDSGRETVDEDAIDLLDDQYSMIFASELQKKNMTFIRDDSQIAHRYVYADVMKLREILMNLISNAIKYTPEGGTITLTFKESAWEDCGYATYIISVQDNGIGMTKEFQKHIFESFTRERNTTESKIMGTGLGMAIVKKLVDLLGGNITVESEPGKGSTFTVSLMLQLAEPPEDMMEKGRQLTESHELDLTGKRILLAEDNELNAEIATVILEDTGATVELAEDGVIAVNMVSAQPAGYYDLVLMDIQMPHLNGYEATKKIRQLPDPAIASVPIVAMTANAFEEDKRNAMEAGMNGYLAKPIDVHTMVDTLQEILG